MKILAACEESQAVTIELRKLGHEAYSCDIEPCSGGHPEWHIQGDVTGLINGRCRFQTVDGEWHEVSDKWDMLIAFPPCTYLSNAGMSNFSQKWATEEYKAERWAKLKTAEKFFLLFANADCNQVVIENPIGYMNTHYRKPDQIIRPYQFGHEVNKPTCLWIKNLPHLVPTKIVPKGKMTSWGKKNPRTVSVWYKEQTRKGCAKNISKLRSKTFPGIAKAMAEQWAGKAEEI